MGYDLYITRRKRWADNGRDITEAEWQAGAAGLNDRCYWSDGNVVAKNPDEVTIDLMIKAALSLKARVVGEEDEEYFAADKPPNPYRLTLLERLWIALQKLILRPKISTAQVDFKVGDRVMDPWKNIGEVLELDCSRDQGLGRVIVRFPNGNRVYMAAASGLTRVDDPVERVQ